MATNLLPAAATQQDSTAAAASRTRDSLAVSSRLLDRLHPRALDLLARLLDGLSDELRGVAGIVSGTHSEDHWREMLRGERTLPLYDVARLATSDRPEARRAVDALLVALAGHRGLAVVARAPRLVEPLAVAASLAGASGPAVAAIIDGLRDGQLDEAERRALKPYTRQLREIVAQLDALDGAE